MPRATSTESSRLSGGPNRRFALSLAPAAGYQQAAERSNQQHRHGAVNGRLVRDQERVDEHVVAELVQSLGDLGRQSGGQPGAAGLAAADLQPGLGGGVDGSDEARLVGRRQGGGPPP